MGEGIFPGGIGTEPGRAADGRVLALKLPVEDDLGGGVAIYFFISEEGHQAFLQSAKAAFDLAFGLRTGRDQMGYSQSGEGALELGTGIPVIRHGIMAKEAETVGVDHHGQAVLEKEASEVFEVVPSGVGGDEDRAQKLARMVIHGQQKGLLFIGGPPLVDGGIVLPEFINA